MSSKEIFSSQDIASKIYTVKEMQVMLDEDLALLYGVETKRINEQVKRNIERFPDNFCFRLSSDDISNLKSQNATSSWGGRRTLPYAFTEQGVAMLSTVIKSDTAIKVSVQIINAFVDLVKSAKKSIVLIDNYIDESVLLLFSIRGKGVSFSILTKSISEKLQLDIKKHNEQYPPANIKEFGKAHDRFLIIDGKTVYHFGASLKDLGKKWFAFSKMDVSAAEMLKEAGELV